MADRPARRDRSLRGTRCGACRYQCLRYTRCRVCRGSRLDRAEHRACRSSGLHRARYLTCQGCRALRAGRCACWRGRPHGECRRGRGCRALRAGHCDCWRGRPHGERRRGRVCRAHRGRRRTCRGCGLHSAGWRACLGCRAHRANRCACGRGRPHCAGCRAGRCCHLRCAGCRRWRARCQTRCHWRLCNRSDSQRCGRRGRCARLRLYRLAGRRNRRAGGRLIFQRSRDRLGAVACGPPGFHIGCQLRRGRLRRDRCRRLRRNGRWLRGQRGLQVFELALQFLQLAGNRHIRRIWRRRGRRADWRPGFGFGRYRSRSFRCRRCCYRRPGLRLCRCRCRCCASVAGVGRRCRRTCSCRLGRYRGGCLHYRCGSILCNRLLRRPRRRLLRRRIHRCWHIRHCGFGRKLGCGRRTGRLALTRASCSRKRACFCGDNRFRGELGRR